MNTLDTILQKAVAVKPSARQLAWQETEFYAFICFTVNTYTDKEWGDGTESPSIFNPTHFDAAQWVDTCQNAGMKGLILTAKHHDGFCLWPSRYTEHSVKHSPWRNGKGDIVGEVAKACRAAGLKFGVYLSPWDRHEPSYGDSPRYNTYFMNQLRELLAQYGELFSVWFDGACGEGPNGKKQEYDFQSFYRLVRELQPMACISVAGPDVRWCGNEAGHCRESEWSVVPAEAADPDAIAAKSQQEENLLFRAQINWSDQDIGSREKIRDAKHLIWYPAEVDTSIRPGWFYHKSGDDRLRSLANLVQLYFGSVGGNATLILNFPPDPRGLIHENDVARSAELGTLLRELFARNLAIDAKASATHTRTRGGVYTPQQILDGRKDTCWMTEDGQKSAAVEFCLPEDRMFNVAMLQEAIGKAGQRVEKFRLSAEVDGHWKTIADSTVIGYKRLLRFPVVTAKKVRVEILESRICPTLSNFGLYYHRAL